MLHLDLQEEAVDWEREQMEDLEAGREADKEIRIEGLAPQLDARDIKDYRESQTGMRVANLRIRELEAEGERVRDVLILAAQELREYLRGQIREQLSYQNWDIADRPDLLGSMIAHDGQRRFPTAFALVEVYKLLGVNPAVGISD